MGGTRLRDVTAPHAKSADPPTSLAGGSVRVRRPHIGDLAALIALENETFVADRLSARQWRYHLTNPNAHVLVATRDEMLIGACVVFFRDNSKRARVYSIATAAAARGAGIGAMLLAAAEAAAHRRGCTAIRLEVRRDNGAAHRLYLRLGYRELGVRAAYYEDGHDAFLFEKPIAIAAPAVSDEARKGLPTSRSR
ncbi:MAG: GNAT family N-acetyltransferase [Dokdonella sp.]